MQHQGLHGALTSPLLLLERGIKFAQMLFQRSVRPAKRGKGNKPIAVDDPQERTSAKRRASMSCTRGHKGTPKAGPLRGRLKRVFTNSWRFKRYQYIDL